MANADPGAATLSGLRGLIQVLGPLHCSPMGPRWGTGSTLPTLRRAQASTHHGEAAPLLPDDGATAQEASHHDERSCRDEDVG